VRRPFPIALPKPIISFTFDDFPKNAATTGTEILSRYGVCATYYVSFGLAGTEAPTGRIFDMTDLAALQAAGHELGCHTFHHSHAWDTGANAFAESIDRNAAQLNSLFGDAAFESLSYPISCPSPAVKKVAQARFSVCRGGGQAPNVGVVDRNRLNAIFLERLVDSPDLIAKLINDACASNAWLIFATHDIAESPTRFGCKPSFFEEVVKQAVASNALVFPVAKAWRIISGEIALP
jgi:peptidoglycan/xylan/chitin deacetylase (PgdA/CDA1 family)